MPWFKFCDRTFDRRLKDGFYYPVKLPSGARLNAKYLVSEDGDEVWFTIANKSLRVTMYYLSYSQQLKGR